MVKLPLMPSFTAASLWKVFQAYKIFHQEWPLWMRTLFYLASDEKVLPFDNTFVHLGFQGPSDLHLIAVGIGTVNVAVAGINGVLHGLLHLAWFGLKNLSVGDLLEAEQKHQPSRYPGQAQAFPGHC